MPERLNRVIIAPPGGAPKTAEAKPRASKARSALVPLPNGLRVLLKRQSHLPLVNVQAYVLGGSLVDTPETAGRSALVGRDARQGHRRA